MTTGLKLLGCNANSYKHLYHCHLYLQKGDLLLSVDGTSLCGLTHSQAVATLKATINLDQVVLGVMDGPETSFGASNFVPSW